MTPDPSSGHPRGRRPAAVLWDLDGTLIDTEPYWFAAERDIVARFSNEWTDEHTLAMVGFDLYDSAAYMQEHGHVDMPAREIVEELLDGVIARLQQEIPWRAGARELLAEVRAAGIPCALVTMSWRRMVDPLLATLPPDAFVATITGDEVPYGKGKPDPTPYLMAAAACGADPKDCVAIEDSPTGGRSAVAAGCQVLAVPNVARPDPGPTVTFAETLDGVHLADLEWLFESAGEATPVASPAPARRKGVLASPVVRVVAALVVLAAVLAAAFALRGDDPPPLPPGAVAVDVWAPYWSLESSLPTLDGRIASIREVSPFWYGAHGVEDIRVDQHANSARIEEFLGAVDGARLVPSIRDEMGAGEMAAILADPASRARHVDALIRLADDLDADGLDIDYEQFAFADGASSWAATKPNWVAFVGELAERLHADGRTLAVSVPGIWSGVGDTPDGYWVYDHAAIAPLADAIRIMAYDYSTSEAGPIAPLPWVDDMVDTINATVPDEHHHKLVLGIPSYGSNWVVGIEGSCPDEAEGRASVTTRNVQDLVERRNGTPEYDGVTGEWSFTYELLVEGETTSCVQHRQVVWVDADGAAARVEIARRAGWGGVALWALGYDSDELWTALVDTSRRPMTATTTP